MLDGLIRIALKHRNPVVAPAQRVSQMVSCFPASGNHDLLVDLAFGTEHERIFVPEAELLTRLPEAIAAMSEPMMSHDCIGFYLLSMLGFLGAVSD